MRIFIFILLLSLSFQSWTKADNIYEFEIGGISIGDSLLDHFSLEEINNMYTVTYPKSLKYIKLGVSANNEFDDYDDLTFHVLQNDKNYKIHTINGVIYFENKMADCLKKKKNVVRELSTVLPEIKHFNYDYKYPDPGRTAGSIAHVSDFEFDDGSSVRVWCVNWNEAAEKSLSYADSLSVSISPNYFFEWLNNEAQ